MNRNAETTTNTLSLANTALIVIDVQNDFCPGGSLAVPDGNAIVPVVNALIAQAAHVVFTQDWHPVNHASFADNHQGAAAFSEIQFPYGMQTLWPAHCIQGSHGAGFHPDLNMDKTELIIRKGFRPDIDSYSAFHENDKTTNTGLAGYLRDRGFKSVVLAGLALDFCVAWSAIDACRAGFSCQVVTDACRAIDLNGSADAAVVQMRAEGVSLIESASALST